MDLYTDHVEHMVTRIYSESGREAVAVVVSFRDGDTDLHRTNPQAWSLGARLLLAGKLVHMAFVALSTNG